MSVFMRCLVLTYILYCFVLLYTGSVFIEVGQLFFLLFLLDFFKYNELGESVFTMDRG